MALINPYIEEEEWYENAACRGTDPALFFPDGTTTPEALEKIDEAKAVCILCDSQTECLRYAIKSNQDSGVWGGTSEMERRQIRRELKSGVLVEADLYKQTKS